MVKDYRLAVHEDDLVVAQITKSILPFVGRSDAPSVLALDLLSLILGARIFFSDTASSSSPSPKRRLRSLADATRD